MNASSILNTVATKFTIANYEVMTLIGKNLVNLVFTLLGAVLGQTIKRYFNRNRSQLNQFYSTVKVFQEILQETEKSFAGTGDNYARQFLEKIKKNLDKCQEVCDQIESQSLAGKFPRSSQQVEELDLLLKNSIHMTNTYLSAYSTGMKADLRHLRAVVHNMQAGMCQLQVHATHTEPKKVKKLIVEELRPGLLRVSWKETTAVDYYEVQYDRQTGHSIEESSTQCLLDSMQFHFPSEKFYNIRVRGVNGCGPGEWSESAVGKFTILPKQPQKPLAVHVNSSTSITLIMEEPVEREGAKPVTRFVVEYHTDEDKRCLKKVVPVNNLKVLTLKGKKAVKIKFKDRRINTALTYHVLISHRNEDGDSLPCMECIEPPPDVPEGLTVAFHNSHGILIEWRETNAYTVDHYEVHWDLNKDTVRILKTKNCFAVGDFLDSYTSYLIKVRAVNRRFRKSEFTEIEVNTMSYFFFTLVVSVPAALIGGVTHVYISFLALHILLIFAFLCISSKHAKLMHCLLALVMIGTIAIAAILDSWYPIEINNVLRVLLVLGCNIGFVTIHYKKMQLVNYMIEKHIASSQLIEQITQIDFSDVSLILGISLISVVLLQCCNYFILMILSMLNY